MPWKLREYRCEDCGRITRRNRKSNDPRVCVDCGRERMVNGWALRRHVHKLARQAEDPPPTCAR